MKKLKAFQQGDGAHWGLSDWYDDGETELKAALDRLEKQVAATRTETVEQARARLLASVGHFG